MWTKRLSDVTAEDVRRLIDEETPEDEELEFKETLPAKNGADVWITGASSIGDRARNEIIEEVIAFANAYGGVLILGIAESGDKPPRAVRANPLPRCADLAERLRLQCRDCIEPQIPLLDVRAIQEDEDGNGFVVFKVPRSRMAPHRHTVTRECYVRRADRSEKMSMREIRDLTLHIEHGLQSVLAQFSARRKAFDEGLKVFRNSKALPAYGLRVTAIPLSPISVERTHNNCAVTPPLISLHGAVNGSEVTLAFPVQGVTWRPVLRGTRTVTTRENISFTQEILNDGTVERVLMYAGQGAETPHIYAEWIMALVANTLLAAERFRFVAGSPDIEYGLELHLTNTVPKLPIGGYGRFPDNFGPLPMEDFLFPRYSVGSRAEFSELCSLVERDMWNAAGEDFTHALRIDFENAAKTLNLP